MWERLVHVEEEWTFLGEILSSASNHVHLSYITMDRGNQPFLDNNKLLIGNARLHGNKAIDVLTAIMSGSCVVAISQ